MITCRNREQVSTIPSKPYNKTGYCFSLFCLPSHSLKLLLFLSYCHGKTQGSPAYQIVEFVIKR